MISLVLKSICSIDHKSAWYPLFAHEWSSCGIMLVWRLVCAKQNSKLITSCRLLYAIDHFQFIKLLMLLITCFLLFPIATLWTAAFTPTQEVSYHLHSHSITMLFIKGDNAMQNAIVMEEWYTEHDNTQCVNNTQVCLTDQIEGLGSIVCICTYIHICGSPG